MHHEGQPFWTLALIHTLLLLVSLCMVCSTIGVPVVANSDIGIFAVPSALSFTERTTASSMIWLRPSAYSGSANLTVSESPSAGLAVYLSPANISANSPSIATFSSDTPGTYTVAITVKNEAGTDSIQVQVTVTPAGTPDFTVDSSVSMVKASQGSLDMVTITVVPTYGFTNSVNVTADAQPSGLSASVTTSSICCGSGSTTLGVDVAGGAPIGTYFVTVIGSSGNLSHSRQIIVTVEAPSQQTNDNAGSVMILGIQ